MGYLGRPRSVLKVQVYRVRSNDLGDVVNVVLIPSKYFPYLELGRVPSISYRREWAAAHQTPPALARANGDAGELHQEPM